MSKYGTVKTTINNAEDLIAGLHAMGLSEVENHVGNPQPLYGYQGDQRSERADIIVRREHVGTASNDLGFRRGADGTFSAIVSEYDKSQGYNSKWHEKLGCQVGKARVTRTAANLGLRSAGAPQMVNGKWRYEYIKA